MTPQVRNNRHSLRFFISRIEGDQSSNSSSSEAIINPPGAFTAGRQPSTKPPSKLAELAAFEDLYYATCCKIRELYANIALRVTHFGADMLQTSLSGSRGSRTLHDFATILSAHWAFLNDPALITTLASAVRAASSTSLWDTNRLPVGAIMALLWEKQQQQPEPFRVFAARLPRAPANTAKPLPPLPAPARAQRYVVAGGLARLEEREEVVVVVPGLVLPQYESVAVGWEEMEGMVERVVMAERVRRGELGDGEGVERVVEGKRRGFGGWRKMRWW